MRRNQDIYEDFKGLELAQILNSRLKYHLAKKSSIPVSECCLVLKNMAIS